MLELREIKEFIKDMVGLVFTVVAVSNNNGIIKRDIELVANSVKFNNNGSVTGNIIIPQA
ncbi:MAG: hypothetical protein ACI4OP_04540 [Candidatus Coprovivens sp.]